MTNTLNVAHIRGGHTSAVGAAHVAALRMDHQFCLVCGYFSTDDLTHQKNADSDHIPNDHISTEASEMLAAEKDSIEPAIILTRQHLNFENIQLYIAHDVDMICKTVVVSTVDRARLIFQGTEKNNHFSAVIFNYGLATKRHGLHGALSWEQSEPEHLIHVDRYGLRSVLTHGSLGLKYYHKTAPYLHFKTGLLAGFVEASANYCPDTAHAYETFKNTKGYPLEAKVFYPKAAWRSFAIMDVDNTSDRTKRWIDL